MMDYKKIPRPLIYKERDNLRDFEVNNPSTLNHQLFALLKANPLMLIEHAKEMALRCFNNAYYICTLIGLEDFPDLCVADYEQLLLGSSERYYEDVCAASMGMVCEMLRAYDYKWGSDSKETIKAIHERLTNFHWINTRARNSFILMEQKCSLENASISHNEFAPRDIYEAVDNISIRALIKYHKDICELLALCTDQRKRIGGADLALARLKAEFHELEQEWGENYDNLLKDTDIEPSDLKDFDEIREAEDDIRDYYPKLQETEVTQRDSTPSNAEELHQTMGTTPDAEMMQAQTTDSQVSVMTKQLQAQVKKLQEELAERDATIEELKEKIADFESRFPIKDIKSRKVCAMTGKQHVILFLAVLAEHNRLPNARTNLSYLMSFIAARNESSMHDYLKDPITQKECEKLAKEFDTVCPFIAKLIRQLPDKLKEDISKKNSAKASKKVKD